MMLAFVFLASAVPEASDDAIRHQAARCGLSSNHLVWSVDGEGHRRADVKWNGDLDGLPYKSFACMLDWAKQTGAKVGWISEPPPSADDLITLAEASEKCGLPKGVLRFQRNGVGGYDIRIERTKPVNEGLIDCALGKLPHDFMSKYGVGPIIVPMPDRHSGD